jgi:dTDP-glucose pyrophosphorylase
MDIKNYLAKSDYDIQKVIETINNNKDGIALVVDENGRLIGSITDGDIRRYMLGGQALDQPCADVMHRNPVTVPQGASRKEIIELIKQHRIRNIPQVDDHGCPVRVVNFTDLINGKEAEYTAVIMAGGEGKRLRPLTETLPKPMLKVGDKPLLEKIIHKLSKAGIRKIKISVNYRAEIIEDYFKDGSAYGVEIQYLREEQKLGTAGALSLIDDLPDMPILVMNGDVVTEIGFERLLDFHSNQRCTITVAATEYHLNIPYGVLDVAGHYVLGVQEKPTHRFLCSAGIYVIDPDIVRMVPPNTYYDMTHLLADVTKRGLPVTVFPIHEYWVDIGQKEDLKRAAEDFDAIQQKKQRGV